MPEGSVKIAWSHKPEAWYPSWLGLGRGIFLLQSLHAGLNFPSLLLVPVVYLSRNMLFLFQEEDTQLFSLLWQSTWQGSKQITLFCQDNKIWCFLEYLFCLFASWEVSSNYLQVEVMNKGWKLQECVLNSKSSWNIGFCFSSPPPQNQLKMAFCATMRSVVRD